MAKSDKKKSSRSELDEKVRRLKQIRAEESRKRLKAIGFVVAIVLALVAGGVAGVMFSGARDNATVEAPAATEPADLPAQKVNRTVSGKSLEEDQKDAIAAAKEVLQAAQTKEGTDYQVRVKAIGEGELNLVPEELKSKIRLAGEFANDKTLETIAYQSIITLSSAAFPGGKTIEPFDSKVYLTVQVDRELGIAYVPFGAFTGTNAPFSLQLVYVDGEWKLDPYSLIQQIKISSMLSGTEAPIQDPATLP